MRAVAAIPVLALILLAGCGQEEADEPSRPTVEFTGKIDPALAGVWQTKNGDSVLTLKDDGSLKIDSTFNTPKGKQKSTREGSWLADAEKIRFRYRESDGSEKTIAYAKKQEADELVLSTKVPKLETRYRRR